MKHFSTKTSSILLALAVLASTIPTSILTAQSATAAESSWSQQTSAGNAQWYSVASSSDGTKLVAASNKDKNNGPGSIFTSTDSGATWTEQTSAGNAQWASVASSSDGTKLVAASRRDKNNGPGSIFTSTDSGATWTKQTSAGDAQWASVASSSDGTKLVVASQPNKTYGGWILTSTDSGATWTQQTAAGNASWVSVASNSDGTKLVAASGSSGSIYTSTDSGATWTKQTSAGGAGWSSVASSSDGTKLVAASATSTGFSPGNIFTSTDSGATWTKQTAAGNLFWASVASSSDGTKLVAATIYGIYGATIGPGSIFTSTDSGATWTEQTSAGTAVWYSVASNSDGTKLVAAQYTDKNNGAGSVWTYSAQAPAPTITSVSPTSGPTQGGTNITITGTGFATGATVTVGGSDCTSVEVVSETSITCATPSGVSGAQDVVVTNADNQTVTSSGAFTYTAPVFSASTPSIPDTYTGSTSATQTETITNDGDGDLVFGAEAVTLSGTNASDFTIVADNCSSQTVAPADTCTVTYTFTPGGVGSRTADLVFTSNEASSPNTVSLSATGVGLPVFSASTPSIPNTYVGSTSATQTETVTNTGNADLVFGAGAVTKTGVNAADFTIVADNCSSQTVAPSGTCTVTYKFKSTVAGTRTANLVFASNATSSPNTVELIATAMGVVTIKEIESKSGSKRGGITVEISGTGFTAGSTVTFGGLNAVVTKRRGTTEITVKTPAHAIGKVAVVVTNPDGGTTTYNSYTYKK